MSVRIGQHEFGDVSYDANGDVLYLSAGTPADADAGDGTPEGHFVRFDETATWSASRWSTHAG
jgi:hypothetical protein